MFPTPSAYHTQSPLSSLGPPLFFHHSPAAIIHLPLPSYHNSHRLSRSLDVTHPAPNKGMESNSRSVLELWPLILIVVKVEAGEVDPSNEDALETFRRRKPRRWLPL